MRKGLLVCGCRTTFQHQEPSASGWDATWKSIRTLLKNPGALGGHQKAFRAIFSRWKYQIAGTSCQASRRYPLDAQNCLEGLHRTSGAHLAVVDDTVEEGTGGEVGKRRRGRPVVQQPLGRQQHQRLHKGAIHLPPQCVEQLRRRRGTHHKQVGLALREAAAVLHHEALPRLLRAPGALISHDQGPFEAKATVKIKLIVTDAFARALLVFF